MTSEVFFIICSLPYTTIEACESNLWYFVQNFFQIPKWLRIKWYIFCIGRKSVPCTMALPLLWRFAYLMERFFRQIHLGRSFDTLHICLHLWEVEQILDTSITWLGGILSGWQVVFQRESGSSSIFCTILTEWERERCISNVFNSKLKYHFVQLLALRAAL